MSIFYMDGETFIKEYINEDPRKVMRTQFVVVSSTIRKTGKYEEQVINANSQLFPSHRLLLDYENYKENEEYWMQYREQLQDSKPLFATLIRYAIEENSIIVFLCGKKEKKFHYFKIMQSFIEDEFGYRIYDYKKLKKGKEKPKEIDEAAVLNICKKVIKKAQKHRKESMMSSERGKQEYFSQMSKKELKKILKKKGLYEDTMTASEMRELLEILS